MKKHILQILLVSIFSLCSGSSSMNVETKETEEEEFCIKPVAEYSVPIQEFYADEESQNILPGYPWEMQSKMPVEENPDFLYEYYTFTLKAIQNKGNYSEIWVLVTYYSDFEDWSSKENFYLQYNTKTSKWNQIPALYYEKFNNIEYIYVSKSGKVWGLNRYPESQYTESMLSYYDENEGCFITDERGSAFTRLVPIEGLSIGNEVVFDDSGYLWILVEHNGIYKYELESGELSREADMPNGDVYGAKILEDGNIYFVMYVGDYDGEDEYDNEKGLVFTFSPQTKEISMIKVPEEALSGGDNAPSDFLFDASGRFWISNLVYKDTDEQWYEILYSPVFLTDQFYGILPDRKYNEVVLLLRSSSSDGRLWYTERMSGTYFTDPDEQKWCWVTTEVSTVLEDGQEYLWMIADDSLYKRPLDED